MADDMEQWLYLFNRGEDFQSYRRLGAHQVGPAKWRFVVWAPNAQAVAIVGDFSGWQPLPLTPVGTTGVWAGTHGGTTGQLYKVQITTADGQTIEKIDPYGFGFEPKPGTAARLMDLPRHDWRDAKWLAARAAKRPYDQPMNIYELHLGSFMRHEDGSYLSYTEAAAQVLPYVRRMGYTHIELMPLMEHLLDASWGYQLMGYFAPTSRFGAPADFLAFVDAAHRLGLGVIMDWVPGHFIRNTDTLAKFDGTATFEYQDPHRANNVRWGTWNFDLGKTQVQSFLISSAMFWLDYCHLDGLRVDAVSNMLYMDYDAGKEQDRNQFGGRENLAGIAFLKALNTAVFAAHPDVLMIAEESSAYPKVSAPIDLGGLGFNYKWNMGWMNDTLRFFEMDPYARRDHTTLLTFSFMYQFDEQFILPFSHDEVVHGKKSLMHKMPGDRYNQFANLRVMFIWLMTHPGKKLLFMGSEWGQFLEWRDWSQLEWVDLNDPMNRQMQTFTETLNKLYRKTPSLWAQDHTPAGISVTMADSPEALSYIRWGTAANDFTVVVMNLMPTERQHFRVAVPAAGTYTVLLNTESQHFGGTWTRVQRTLHAQTGDYRGQPASLEVVLPAMGALLIAPVALTPRAAPAGLGEADSMRGQD
ncbi:1,4-alpha-glucan branching protein GlgB [Lacticaseibacillus daqingensis]|uniref:1,4-alpha-glucan branching protein GlgB n=1 Tax=Lacticaseibacillus daqingensis TaxID=2486014 RepID=UPI000F7A298C|nr:1,4-alpha-glucan branching protein GlgB [Lacticaseibacillus daqingensis]